LVERASSSFRSHRRNAATYISRQLACMSTDARSEDDDDDDEHEENNLSELSDVVGDNDDEVLLVAFDRDDFLRQI